MVACRFLEQLDKADVDAILVPRGFANEGLSLVISIDSLRLYFRSAIENKLRLTLPHAIDWQI
jgi:hypothetical protein